MEIFKVCNGVSWPLRKFKKEEEQRLLKKIPEQRLLFIESFGIVNHEAGTYASHRFASDEDVINTMASAVKRRGNLSDEEFIDSALFNCAERDYYYNFEKKWEFEDDE